MQQLGGEAIWPVHWAFTCPQSPSSLTKPLQSTLCLVSPSIPTKGSIQLFSSTLSCRYKHQPALTEDISSCNLSAETKPSQSLTSTLGAWMLLGARCEVGMWPESWSLLSCSRTFSSSRIFTLSTSHIQGTSYFPSGTLHFQRGIFFFKLRPFGLHSLQLHAKGFAGERGWLHPTAIKSHSTNDWGIVQAFLWI